MVHGLCGKVYGSVGCCMSFCGCTLLEREFGGFAFGENPFAFTELAFSVPAPLPNYSNRGESSSFPSIPP